MNIKVSKQSKVDWLVYDATVPFKNVAWISLRDSLYFVRFSGQTSEYPYSKFAEAKAFAIEHA